MPHFSDRKKGKKGFDINEWINEALRDNKFTFPKLVIKKIS